ncbi:MAG: prenyltransferase/squalene oxidase repeat-containing protein [Planctomycetota bacterium]
MSSVTDPLLPSDSQSSSLLPSSEKAARPIDDAAKNAATRRETVKSKASPDRSAAKSKVPSQNSTTEGNAKAAGKTQSTLVPDLDRLAAAANMGDEDEPDDDAPRRRFLLFQATPAWLISTLIHVGIILVLGLVTLADPIKIVNVLSASSGADDGPEIEEFTIEEIDPGEMAEMEEFTEPVEMTELVEMVEPVSVEVPMEMAAIPMEMADLAAEMAPSAPTLQTLASVQMSALDSRSSDMKKRMLREYGGNAASEAAVTEALKWFALHQMPNGGWTFNHSLVCKGACDFPGDPKRAELYNGATALALLPFLGAGQTHYNGEYKETVRRGLLFLVQNGKPGRENGLPVLDLSEKRNRGNLYSHGLAAIVLCEAYAMTEDPALAGPAQQAVNFIIAAQCSDGGWRYTPRQANGGDTSVVGWQLMALKSGYMGHLIVPQQTIVGSTLFLNKVQSNGGAWYGYDKPSTSMRSACTAVGLLCRMYTGWEKTHPGLMKGVDSIAKKGVLKNDMYYNYYAAQVLRQHGGPKWDKFNAELRDWLVETQAQRGGAKGSWNLKSSHLKDAGRLGITSFATMILEVYYRHMPLYSEQAEEDEFPL